MLYAEPDYIQTLLLTPNDPLFSNQWWQRNTGQFGGVPDKDIDGDDAWNTTTGVGSSIEVGVIDSGIDLSHPDLGTVTAGPNYIGAGPPEDDGSVSHGTAVAGIIGARGNNGAGVAGINWGASLIAIKVCDSQGLCPSSGTLAGVDWARANGISIVNLSLGGYSFSQTALEVYRNAFSAGMLCVAAMGNDDTNVTVYPAGYAEFVYAVGAVYNNGDRWLDEAILDCSFGNFNGSNIGNHIDIAAPGGRSIATTKRVSLGSYYAVPTKCTDGFGGTSAATPVVAGAAALLASYRPSLSGEDLSQILNRTAVDNTVAGIGWDDETGYGVVNVNNALQFVAPGRVVQRATQSNITDPGYTQMNMTFFGVPGLANGTYPTRRHEVLATVTFSPPYLAQPDAWARKFETVGWSAINPRVHDDQPIGWCSLVDGSLSPSSMQLRAFTFEVFGLDGSPLGWFPASPANIRMAWTAVGPVSLPDAAQSYYVPQIGSVASPTEGTGAIALFRACPNNDNASVPNHARIKIVAKDAAGVPMPNISSADIFVLFNGGTAAQGFTGPGADSVIANSAFNPVPLCPDVRTIFADAPTDANGVTYITFKGSTPGSPGVATRNPQRKWGHYDSKFPVFVSGVELQGRLTSVLGNGSYELQIKNLDFEGGLGTALNQGELVNSLDFNSVSAHLGEQDSADAKNWWRDFDSNGSVGTTDFNLISAHVGHKCDSPNNP